MVRISEAADVVNKFTAERTLLLWLTGTDNRAKINRVLVWVVRAFVAFLYPIARVLG